MVRGWKDWVRGIAIWGIGPNNELTRIRTDERGYLQVLQVPHHHTHEDGGSDEINVQGLSGVLADLQRGKFSFVGNWDDFPAPGEPDRLAFAVDQFTVYRDTGTEWQKVATAHWDYLEGAPSDYFPSPHASTHEEGGSDALTPTNIGANWNKLVNKPSTFPPSAHASSHQPGGSDALPTAAPAPITEGATGAEGSSTALARADHVHETPSEWTPKEHGNEKHNPDFLAVDGSNTMQADLSGTEMGYLKSLRWWDLLFRPGVTPSFYIPYLWNDIAYNLKRGGSANATPSPDSGSLDYLFDMALSKCTWYNPTGTIVIEVTSWRTLGYGDLIHIMQQTDWYAKDVKIEVYNPGSSTWEELVNITNNDKHQISYAFYKNYSFTKFRISFSNFNNPSYFQLFQIAVMHGTGAVTKAAFVGRDGGDIYGDIDMHGREIKNVVLETGVSIGKHAESHENGGADEINVQGLSGQLADPQKTTWDLVANKPSTFTPSPHSTSHYEGYTDELSVGKLEGTWGGATQIHSGSCPTAWSDLDLSSYVGSRRALVLIKVKNQGPYAQRYKFRPNGDTDDYTVASDQFQGTACIIASGYSGWIFVTTDANGIVEWATNNGYDSTLWLVGYIALS